MNDKKTERRFQMRKMLKKSLLTICAMGVLVAAIPAEASAGAERYVVALGETRTAADVIRERGGAIYRKGVMLGNDKNVATGDRIIVEQDTASARDIVVKGDLLGTGKVTLPQLVRLAQGLSKQKPLNDLEFAAADIDDSGTLTINDLVRCARVLAPGKPQQPGKPSGPLAEMRTVCVAGTNAIRAKEGKSPLTESEQLNQAAQVRAIEMANTDKMSHTRPDGTSCFTVFTISSGAKAENIAYNYGTAATISAKMTAMWDKSAGHHKNMVNDMMTHIGTGFAQSASGTWYGCQLFASTGNINWVDTPKA